MNLNGKCCISLLFLTVISLSVFGKGFPAKTFKEINHAFRLDTVIAFDRFSQKIKPQSFDDFIKKPIFYKTSPLVKILSSILNGWIEVSANRLYES